MKLENDAIIIENRNEVADIADMIDCYLNSSPKMQHLTENELRQLRQQLDVLFLCW